MTVRAILDTKGHQISCVEPEAKLADAIREGAPQHTIIATGAQARWLDLPSEQKFKGGLADAHDPQVVRYHTATHLLQQALHDVLGEDRAAVGAQGRIQQRHVGGVGEHALVDRRLVRQRTGGPDPDIEAPVLELLAEIARLRARLRRRRQVVPVGTER